MVDVNEHNGIKITEKGFLFLKKKESVNFRKLTEKQKARKEKPHAKPRMNLENDLDQALYENLKTARQQMAKKRRVPAYVIFHDKTLIELAKARPQSFDEMLEHQRHWRGQTKEIWANSARCHPCGLIVSPQY
jgi:ATP-dependent DNA helicase RecQ